MICHKDLDVWRLAMDFVEMIYRCTAEFPKEEIYGLTSQLRRAAVSIPSNVAEGAARQTAKENAQFLYYARGSVAEMETQLELVRRLGYLTSEKLEPLLDILKRVGQMIQGLIKKLKSQSR